MYCKLAILDVHCALEATPKLMIFAHSSCHEQVTNPKPCPTCKTPLKLPHLLHIRHDGYVCEECRIYYGDDMKAIALIF